MDVFIRMSNYKPLKFYSFKSFVRPNSYNNAVLCPTYLVVSLVPFYIKLT
jgi:hypothetical protein